MAKALTLFAVQPQGTLADNAPLMLYTRLAEMLSFAAHIHNVDNVAELHAMRIASKRLRYTLEIFAPAFEDDSPTEYPALLETVKSIQEQLGEIHDCDVRIERIGAYLKSHAQKYPEMRVGLQNLVAREAERRSGLYHQFEQRWRELDGQREFELRFLIVVLKMGASVPASLAEKAAAKKKSS